MGIAPRRISRIFSGGAVRRLLATDDATRPSDALPAIPAGDNPDRILLVGNGALNGWGVTRVDEAIPGHLATAFAERTGHSVHVDLVNHPPAVCTDLPGLLREREIDLLDYDAVVVVIGVSDALQKTPPAEWSTAVTTVLDLLRAEAPSVDVVWVGAQPPSTVPLLEQPAGGPADRLAADLNARAEALCRGRATFLRPPAVAVLGPRTRTVTDPAEIARAAEGYRLWGVALADRLVTLRQISTVWGR